jgi:hypothetical protein
MFNAIVCYAHMSDLHIVGRNIKATPVTGHGGPYSCETSRLSHFLENRLTDGGDVVSLTVRPATLYPQDDS